MSKNVILQFKKSLALSAISIFILALMLPQAVFAAAGVDSIVITSTELTLSTDDDNNDIANIGDAVTVVVELENDDGCAGTTVTADMTVYGGGVAEALESLGPCTEDPGGTFELIFEIVDAGEDGIDVAADDALSAVTVTADDADEDPVLTDDSNNLGDGAVDTTATGGVDTVALTVDDANVSTDDSACTGTGNVCLVGDTVTITWDNSVTGDNNADTVSRVELFGDGDLLFEEEGDLWTFDFVLPAGDGDVGAFSFPVFFYDNANNETQLTDDDSVSYDQQSPDGVENFSISSSTDSTVTLAWTASEVVDFAAYRIYYRTSTGVTNLNGTLWGSSSDADLATMGTESTVVTGLSASTTYFFTIYQEDDAGNLSEAGTEVTVITAAATVTPSSGDGGGGTSILLLGETDASDDDSSNDAVDASEDDMDSETFKDIDGHWAEVYIQKLKDLGVVDGKSVDVFAPDDSVTRAELVKMVLGAFDIHASAVSNTSFSDVETSAWFAAYVERAKIEGIVEGYGDGTFRPNEGVNRVEALAIILNASPFQLAFANDFVFPDTDDAAWYANLISFAVEYGVISGYENGNFGPDDSLTRAQAAKIIVLVMGIK